MRERTRGPVGSLRAPGMLWAALTLLACLIATTAAWYATKSTVDARARAQFDFAAARLVDAVRERVSSYGQVLWGGAGLFAASSEVTREEWRAYVQALGIEERLPGIQGLGFARIVPASEREAHIAAVRAGGFPDYTIWPEGERDPYTTIVYLEPFEWRNQRAFGYDMFSEPVRRAAMQQARDTDQAAVSGKVTLVQETNDDIQSGFLIYVPIYRAGAPLASVEQRRAALTGYVFAPFRVYDLIRLGGLARQASDAGLGLEIYDGVGVQKDALLFTSRDPSDNALASAAFVSTITESVSEHPWTFRFAALPAFTAGIDWQRPLVVLLAGLVISLLAGSVVGTLVAKRAQAVEVNRRLSVEIARQEQAERRLRQSETKFRSLFSFNPLPTFAYDARTLQFIEVNDATVAKYGYSRAELETMRITDLRPFEDVPRLLEHLGGGGRRPGRRVGEWRHMTKDGQIIDVEVTADDMELSGRQITLTVVQDITARKKAQESLIESERMARGIVETALDAFVQMDESGAVVDWNAQAERTFGFSREEAIGRQLASLIVPPAFREAHREGLARFLCTGQGSLLGTRFETEALRRDGSTVRVELAVTALRRRSGHVFNGFIRDLTEKLAADEQLRQSQKMDAVGQLTGGIAHDFNNILTVITGTIEILAEGVADRPKLAAIAQMIDEAATRGAELTQGLLAFARRQPLQPREIDVNALLGDTARLLRPTLGEQIEIGARLEPGAWHAHADPGQLSTALINLALNARDAMPAGGKLTLETGNVVLDESYGRMNPDVRPGSYVMIAVSDTGAGIPAPLLPKVFEPFFTTKETGKGTGLGLSMVYGFVKQSGGHIKIYSEEGCGTTIKVYLPRTGEAAAAGEALPVARPERGHETILVVEDDPLVRNYVVAQLASLGYATLAAGNAGEALRLVDEGAAFDLLFTDVIMPGGLNGRQLAEEVTKRRGAVKVLYTSGYTEDAIVHHGRLDPGVALLNKPYRKSELARKVREVLDTVRAA
ncbi:MAG: CHASE domain-containing protein [Xanthobacteraceae bacterium]|nr:CHASE domain-containing protein [Xanthobacteraceae bacterium]